MISKIYLRVDGNASIGHGHLVRCIALAQMLDKDFQINFICNELPKSVEQEILLEGWNLIKIRTESSWLSSVKKNSLVVLDGYHFNLEIQKRVKESGALLVCIDDTHETPFVADLVLNHTQGVKTIDYHGSASTQYATGFDHALVRKEFLEIKEIPKKTPLSLFICLGGSDIKNLSQVVIEEALRLNLFQIINIVTGSSFANTAAINSISKKNKIVTHHVAITSSAMRNLMLCSEIAVVPSSGLLLEALACKCKIISGMYIDNQKIVYEEYKKQGVFIDAGNFKNVEIRSAFKSLNKDSNCLSENLLDGLSNVRILKLFNQLSLSSQVVLRSASITDLEITYRWASDPIIRSYSFNKRPITHDEHIAWFKTKLNNANCLFYLAELNGVPIGSIRFDVFDKKILISYLVSSEMHGKGLGSIILSKGLEKISSNPELKSHTVIGFVLSQNLASLKAFRRFAFKESIEHNSHKFEMKLHDKLI